MLNYSYEARIGHGAYGVVFRAKCLKTQEIVAIKQINIKSDLKSQLEVFREISALQNSTHPNIICLKEVQFSTNTVTLVLEYADSNLKLVIEDVRKPRNCYILKFYFSQIMFGLAHLHRIGIMHRDMKPDNILINSSNRIKIADFGLACLYYPADPKRVYDHEVATRWYRAPELLFGATNYGPSIDVWATGCVLAEFLNSSPFFPGTNDIDQIVRVFHVLGTPTDTSWPGWEKLPDAGKVVFDTIAPISDWTTIVDIKGWCATETEYCNLLQILSAMLCLNPSERFTVPELMRSGNKFFTSHTPKSIAYSPPRVGSTRSKAKESLHFDETLIASHFGLI